MGEEGAAERARRFLRRDGEEKLAEGSRKFLAAFGDVDKVSSTSWQRKEKSELIRTISLCSSQKLDTLQLHMQEMHTRCDDVQAKLEEANSGTKFLLERAEGLRNQRSVASSSLLLLPPPPPISPLLLSASSRVFFLGCVRFRTSIRLRATLINLFLSRFTLAQSELETLTSRDVPVGLPLFAAMDRVKEIRKDCRALLGGEEGGTTAG